MVKPPSSHRIQIAQEKATASKNKSWDTQGPRAPQYFSKTKPTLVFFCCCFGMIFAAVVMVCVFRCCCLGMFLFLLLPCCVFSLLLPWCIFLLLLPCCAACCRFLVVFFATVASVSFCCCCLYVLFAIVALVCVSFQFLP